MGERHIKEDYVSCDWCKVEQVGFRCSKESSIEKLFLGKVNTSYESIDRGWSGYSGGRSVVKFTGLDVGDLCVDCRKKLYEHIQSFIPTAKYVENEVIHGD